MKTIVLGIALGVALIVVAGALGFWCGWQQARSTIYAVPTSPPSEAK